MGKLKTVELTKAQRIVLEQGYRAGKSHSFRVRCQIILLKCERRTSAEIAQILGCCEMVVNNWLKRFEAEGIEGLHTKPGRGRKPILDAEKALPSVKAAVTANGQRVSLAMAELEAELAKPFNQKTLERYTKNLLFAINDAEKAPQTLP